MQRSSLEYNGRQLGWLDEVEADFPNGCGRFSPVAESTWPEPVRRYQAYSIRLSDLLESESEDATGYADFIAAHEYEHLALINSRQWTITDQAGHSTRILIPIFHSDATLTWRPDFEEAPSPEDSTILEALRAARGRLTPVQLAELLGKFRGELTQSTLVFYFKRAFPDIPLQTILESAVWFRVTGGSMDDTQFNAHFKRWLPDDPNA
jgi:hypothetical protein